MITRPLLIESITRILSQSLYADEGRRCFDPQVGRQIGLSSAVVSGSSRVSQGCEPALRYRYIARYFPAKARHWPSNTLIPSGKVIRDPEELQRFKSLAIPPAWREVWICPVRNGHLQATGRDAKGRKQHRYHPRWREIRDENKYGRILAFAKALPLIREKVTTTFGCTGLPRDKILATVVRLLETSHIRVGNEEYARQNKSLGLATLRNRHVNVSGSTIRFEFRGKSGVEHALDINDRRLAKIIKRCQDLPGYELFQYLDDDGERHTIDSTDVNEYIRQIAGEEFSTKDFRTWAGTVLAARALQTIRNR